MPLDEAALLISAHANPSLDVAAQLCRLDRLAGRVCGRDSVAVAALLFGELGLQGDRDSYGDPANSYLDRVLDRRRGIPISLSVLLIEIGRRCDVPLEGVGMPGHFLVRDPLAPAELIDAFDRGRRIDRVGCERLLRATTGGMASLTPEMLAATPRRAVVARMLANLDASFDRAGDREALAWVSSLRLAIPGAPLGDRVQLARRLGAMGRFDSAAALLEESATSAPVTEARDRLLAEAGSLRALLN